MTKITVSAKYIGQIYGYIKTIFMKQNMGAADRLIRVLIAAAIVVLYFLNILSGTLAIVLLVLAGVFLLTSLIGFCPLYTLFGITTCPVRKRPS